MKLRNSTLLCALLAAPLFAAEETSAPATTGQTQPVAAATSGNYQLLPSPVEAGRIAFSNRQNFTVQVLNSGKDELTLKKVRPSCTCLQVESFTDKPIKPGDRGEIKCIITADEKEGQTRKLLYIHLSDSKNPIAQVTVNATFTKPEGSKVVLSNQTLEFGKVSLNQSATHGKVTPATTSVVDGKSVINADKPAANAIKQPDAAATKSELAAGVTPPASNAGQGAAGQPAGKPTQGSAVEADRVAAHSASEVAKGKRLAVCRIMNFGDQPLRITEIVNKNKALELRLDSTDPVEPHKGVTLRAYLDPQAAGKGALEEEVFLMTDSVQTPAVSLKVTATVE